MVIYYSVGQTLLSLVYAGYQMANFFPKGETVTYFYRKKNK